MHNSDDKDKDTMQRWADALPSYESTYQHDKAEDVDDPEVSEVPDLEALEKFDWSEDEEKAPQRSYYGLAILVGVALLIVPNLVARVGGLVSILFGLYMVFRQDKSESTPMPNPRPRGRKSFGQRVVPDPEEEPGTEEISDTAEMFGAGEMFGGEEKFGSEDSLGEEPGFGRKVAFASDEVSGKEEKGKKEKGKKEKGKKEKQPVPMHRQLLISFFILLVIMGITFLISSYLFTDVFTGDTGRM